MKPTATVITSLRDELVDQIPTLENIRVIRVIRGFRHLTKELLTVKSLMPLDSSSLPDLSRYARQMRYPHLGEEGQPAWQ